VVENAGGAPVADLRAEELELRHGRRRIDRFRLLPGAGVPLDLVLLVDTSTTMLASQAEVRAGLGAAVGGLLGEHGRVSLLEFDARLRTSVPFTDDRVWLSEAIATLDSVGGTALYDAVAGAVAAFQGSAGRRAILLVSDGFDRDSRLDLQAAVRVVRRAGIPVFVLRVPGSGLGIDPALDTARGVSAIATARYGLALLARSAGGTLFEVRNEESLWRALAAIHRELSAQYLLLVEGDDTEGSPELSVRILREGRYRARLRGGER
jgi:VWFA-related protein